MLLHHILILIWSFLLFKLMIGTQLMLLSLMRGETKKCLENLPTLQVILDYSISTITLTHSLFVYPMPCFYLSYEPTLRSASQKYIILFFLSFKFE